MPMKASMLGLASPFSKTDSPEIKRYLLFFAASSSPEVAGAASVFSVVSSAPESSVMERPRTCLGYGK